MLPIAPLGVPRHGREVDKLSPSADSFTQTNGMVMMPAAGVGSDDHTGLHGYQIHAYGFLICNAERQSRRGKHPGT